MVARVSLLDVPYHVDKMYDYYIPSEFSDKIRIGGFIIVPFGNSNRKQTALVFDLPENGSVPDDRLKPILSLCNDSLFLNSELLGLCSFIKEYNFCSMGDIIRTVLPSAAFSKFNELYSIVSEMTDINRSNSEILVYNYIKIHERVSLTKIISDMGDNIKPILSKLETSGFIECEIELSGSTNKRFVTYYILSDEATDKKLRSAKQIAVVEALTADERLSEEELKAKTSVTSAQLKSMTEKGLLISESVDFYRIPYTDTEKLIPQDENILSEEQNTAYEKITELYNTGMPKAVLLHGVTGSGKTRVIKAVMDRVIESGRKVITLIPEIALTPQTVGVYRSYYGDRVAVIHSGLSAGERFDAWRRMKNGDVDICIGTRSAVFAPFDNIGMIVIDEEQEHTYKSDMNPKYHARDIARYRCAKNNALMLLASATPSVESYTKALKGVYTLIELNERYGDAKLPHALIVDMRSETQDGNMDALGGVLCSEIQTNLENGSQTILLLNRRGYNKFISCPICGATIMCPHCSIALTYHITGYSDDGYLCCHYCGYRQEKPSVCPSCGSKHIRYLGYGTQKVEEELTKHFVGCRVMRMDADTTSLKFAYDGILERFRNHEADILLGTQMVAKGHDFPDVTLVGVLSADMSLYLDDFKANEKSFDLIAQVIGRAGRGYKTGRAVIQTYNPEHPVLKLAAAQDYKNFYKNEVALRKVLVFPPFCDIISVTFTSENEVELLSCATAFAVALQNMNISEFSDVQLIVYGPFEAPVYRLNKKFRLRLVVKCRAVNRTRELFKQLLGEFTVNSFKNILITIDINPNNT